MGEGDVQSTRPLSLGAFVEQHRGLFTAIGLFTALAGFARTMAPGSSRLEQAVTFLSLCTASTLWIELLRVSWTTMAEQSKAKQLGMLLWLFSLALSGTALLLVLVLASVNQSRAILVFGGLLTFWLLGLIHSRVGQSRIWRYWHEVIYGFVWLIAVLLVTLFVASSDRLLEGLLGR